MENWLHPELPKTENERFRQYLESKENGKGYEKDMTIKAHAELVEFGEQWEFECFKTITNEEGEITFEVKFDGQAQKTGNLFIETNEWVKDVEHPDGGYWKETGIRASKAQIYFFWFPIGNEMCHYEVSRDNLYEIENYLKKISRWEPKVSKHEFTTKKKIKGWLLPIDVVAPQHIGKLEKTILSKNQTNN